MRLERKKGDLIKKMSKNIRDIILKCMICKRKIMWNDASKCLDYVNQTRTNEITPSKEQDRTEISESTNKKKGKTKALLLENKGWISLTKNDKIMRILYMNPHRFGSNNIDKVKQLKKEMNEYKTDVVMMSSPYRR